MKNKHFTRPEANCLRKTYLNNGFSSRHFICNMSKHMKDNLPYLQVLVKSKSKLRKLLIEHGPVSLITSICECALVLIQAHYCTNVLGSCTYFASTVCALLCPEIFGDLPPPQYQNFV